MVIMFEEIGASVALNVHASTVDVSFHSSIRAKHMNNVRVRTITSLGVQQKSIRMESLLQADGVLVCYQAVIRSC